MSRTPKSLSGMVVDTTLTDVPKRDFSGYNVVADVFWGKSHRINHSKTFWVMNNYAFSSKDNTDWNGSVNWLSWVRLEIFETHREMTSKIENFKIESFFTVVRPRNMDYHPADFFEGQRVISHSVSIRGTGIWVGKSWIFLGVIFIKF